MILSTDVFGLSLELVIIVLLILILALGVGLIITITQLQKISRKYYALTTGSTAKDLEHIMLTRFAEMDKVKARIKKYNRDHREYKGHLDSCYNKMGLVKYDAFQQMGGQLSFSLAVLDENDNGFIMNSVHSAEGCYSYTKEIKQGQCSLTLGDEEKMALDMAMAKP